LSPVLGFATFAYQRISTVADHYAYLPMVAAGAAAGALAAQLMRRAPSLAVGLWVAMAVAGGVLTSARLAVWKSDDRFFGAMLAANPQSFSALSNLAKAACDRGDMVEGAELAARALAITGENPATLATRAHCLFGAGRYAEVLAFRQRLKFPSVGRALEHDHAAAASLFNSIAGAYFLTGNPGSGLAHLCQALGLAPNDQLLRANLRDVTETLARSGRVAQCAPARSVREFLQWSVPPELR
jgi:tetratricopeptide (TPR) repeat protein